MRRRSGVIILAVSLGACGGPAPPTTAPAVGEPSAGVTAAPTSPASSTPAAVSPVAATPLVLPSVSLPPAAGSPMAGFALSRTPTGGGACPLEPGIYQTEGHDRVELAIADDGWQEDPVSGTTDVVLSRTDRPDRRLTVDLGDTSAVASDDELLAILEAAASIHVGPIEAVRIGADPGFAVRLAPTEPTALDVDGVGTYELRPGTVVRVTLVQSLMGGESMRWVALVEAPSSDFDAFVPVADDVLGRAVTASG